MTTKRMLKAIIASVLSLTLIMPVEVLAVQQPDRRERNHQERRDRNHNTGQRPGNNNKPNRPGNSDKPNRPGNSNKPNRPGNSNKPNRPGNSNKPNRPGNNNKPNRPGHSNKPNRPGHNNRPNRPTRPGGHVAPPPHRPYRPVYHGWHRPTPPPPAWRPHYNAPAVATILGLAFGTALGTSLAYLSNSGYNVDGYQNNVVYLRDVAQLNYTWPDAALYYDNGCLVGSEYNYSTPYADAGRYNVVYNSLYGNYGAPVSVTTPAVGVRLATWYTPGNGYITLRYSPQSFGGGTRYYTTLTVGRY